MKNKVHLLLLLFVFTFSKTNGQTIIYKYNKQGSCVSRIIKTATPKVQRTKKTSTDNTKSVKVDVSPSPVFQEKISVSVLKKSFDCNLSYIMSNLSGQVFFEGLIDNGGVILTTTALPKGIYIFRVQGENIEESYKLLKK